MTFKRNESRSYQKLLIRMYQGFAIAKGKPSYSHPTCPQWKVEEEALREGRG